MGIFVTEEEIIECAFLEILVCLPVSTQYLQIHDNEDSPVWQC